VTSGVNFLLQIFVEFTNCTSLITKQAPKVTKVILTFWHWERHLNQL